jgi:hypothetical protein
VVKVITETQLITPVILVMEVAKHVTDQMMITVILVTKNIISEITLVTHHAQMECGKMPHQLYHLVMIVMPDVLFVKMILTKIVTNVMMTISY